MQTPIPLVLALLAIPAPALAQAPPASPAAEASTAVAAPTYHPALDYQPRGVVEPRDTDAHKEREAWRAANDGVGQFRRGHIDILRWERARQAPAETRP